MEVDDDRTIDFDSASQMELLLGVQGTEEIISRWCRFKNIFSIL